VTIQHEAQRCTSYRNLQGPLPVSRGSQVSQGEVIGYLGGGALVRPDVLHFFVNGGANCTTNVDPAPHLGIR
jgi:murein DD-endopeptidase MepM/ murein hydrolase activator NlpD